MWIFSSPSLGDPGRSAYAFILALPESILALSIQAGAGDHTGQPCALLSLSRSTRCRIFPVAVRGISASLINEIERGRL
jgi:hypothetical protein